VTRNEELALPIYIKRNLGGTDQNGSVLFLLHGYGSNERDLMSLTPFFPTSGDVVALRAPIELRDDAYCWFPIQGHTTGTQVDTMAYHLAGDQLEAWIDLIVQKEKWEGRKIFIAGFSQGAMMSYEMVRRRASKLHGVVGFSGSSKALNYMPSALNCEVDIFMAHGKQDQVLTFESGKEAQLKLEQCAGQVEFYAFEGGHQITNEVMKEAHRWLMRRW
jgi:phospholipase/carboxylesterase